MTDLDQPLITVFPGGDARLPIEPQVLNQLHIMDPDSLPNIPVSCLTSPKVGGFGRTAQATCLLDQVFKSFDIPDIDLRLLQLDRLDTNIQAFLSLVMPQCEGQPGIFCAGMHIAIRSVHRSSPLPPFYEQPQQHSPNLSQIERYSHYIGTSSTSAPRLSEPISNHWRSGTRDRKKHLTPLRRWSSTLPSPSSLTHLPQTWQSTQLISCLQRIHM